MKKIAMAGLLLVVLACRGESDNATTTTAAASAETDTASATHPASPGGTALVPEVESGTTVLVLLNDNSIAVREQAIPPGPAVLTIENGGKEVHNLFVEGPGVSAAAGDTIAEGKSATMDVTFQPGTYTLYCPVAKHRDNGEQVTVTIAAR